MFSYVVWLGRIVQMDQQHHAALVVAVEHNRAIFFFAPSMNRPCYDADDIPMRSLSSFILAIWIALASSLPAIGQMQGLVLCFSSQGHVAIEAEHVAPNCADLCDSETKGKEAAGHGVDSEPHSCFDITLSSLDVRVNRIRRLTQCDESDVAVGSAVVLAPLGDFDALALNPQRAMGFVEDRFEELRSLRTVILRI